MFQFAVEFYTVSFNSILTNYNGKGSNVLSAVKNGFLLDKRENIWLRRLSV